MTEVEISQLTSEPEWVGAFSVMKQLRTHLEQAQYLEYFERMSADGYRLFGVFVDGELTTLAGVDISTNLYYGRHLWVSELVTASDHRSMGYGRQLFAYLADWAKEHGCETVALSSGLQREQAHRFYEDHIGMNRSSYVFTLDLD